MRHVQLSLPNNGSLYERDDIKKFLASRVARPSSAGVILENAAGEALLLKAHYKSYWSFPGGWIEDTQTPAQTALRELEEETGIVLVSDDISFAYVLDRVSDIMHTYQFIFRATRPIVPTQNITLQTDEIAAYKFVNQESVLADAVLYGEAVVAWARDDKSGYMETQLTNT